MATPKSYWNYRVVADFNNVEQEALRQWSFTIRDVYYTNGKPTSWGAEPQYPCGEDTQGVISDLENMNKAYLQPLLVEVDNKLVEYPKKSAILIKPSQLKKYEPTNPQLLTKPEEV
jgi:hypothetical protein